MTPLEENAVAGLYKSTKARFMELEQKHFKLVGGTSNKSLIEAFPEESEAVRQGWSLKLKELIGEDRATLLDQLIRTPMDEWRRHEAAGRLNRTMAGPSLDRFQSGMEDVKADIRSGGTAKARLRRFMFSSRSGGFETRQFDPLNP